MPGHERYEELGALAAIGQLAEDEAEELCEHLSQCESCKDVQVDYALILDQLPSVAPVISSPIAKVVREARREQFIRRGQLSGIPFTKEAIEGTKRVPWRNWKSGSLYFKASFALAAGVMVVLFVFYDHLAQRHNRISESSAVVSIQSAAANEGRDVKTGASPVKESGVHRNGGDLTEKQIKQLREEVNRLRDEREWSSAEASLWRGKASELSSRLEEDRRAAEDAKARVSSLESGQSEMVATLVEKEQKIQDLKGGVAAQASIVERERELNAAARDVRELMSARNLHIIDVADVDGRGKARKSFGRVFYVEGHSLLFYAFDLDETASPSKVLFQAWGQQEGVGGKPRNLGVFRIDDQTQKRWILRVDDPKLLASIDSLFVTVEPSPGTDQPTGHRLIYAYLGTPANHP
jgi:hypothetical protein